jgi:hypothetical protein
VPSEFGSFRTGQTNEKNLNPEYHGVDGDIVLSIQNMISSTGMDISLGAKRLSRILR